MTRLSRCRVHLRRNLVLWMIGMMMMTMMRIMQLLYVCLCVSGVCGVAIVEGIVEGYVGGRCLFQRISHLL